MKAERRKQKVFTIFKASGETGAFIFTLIFKRYYKLATIKLLEC
jgi:hypothetical protein